MQQVESIYESDKKNISKNEIEYTLRTGNPTIKMELEFNIKMALEKASDIVDFANRLNQQGIRLLLKQDPQNKPIGILFLLNSHTISGSKINKEFSLPKILEKFNLKDHVKLPQFANYINEKTDEYLLCFGRPPYIKFKSDESHNSNHIKAILEEMLKDSKSLNQFIKGLEQHKINCLFNVAKTGRVTGLSLIYEGIIYKSSEINRKSSANKILIQLGYEQVRDSKTISETNARTRAKYGEEIPGTGASKIRHAAKKSKDIIQSDTETISPVQSKYFNRKNESNSGSTNGINQSDAQTSSDFVPSVHSIVDVISALGNHGYSDDGLNTRRNNRKKYKPSL